MKISYWITVVNVMKPGEAEVIAVELPENGYILMKNNTAKMRQTRYSEYAQECINDAVGFEVKWGCYTGCFATLDGAEKYLSGIMVGFATLETVHSGDENFIIARRDPSEGIAYF